MFGAKKWFVGVDGSAIVEIRDVEAARRRYAEKLRLTYSAEENEPEWAGFSLGYSAEEIHICWCGMSGKIDAADEAADFVHEESKRGARPSLVARHCGGTVAARRPAEINLSDSRISKETKWKSPRNRWVDHASQKIPAKPIFTEVKQPRRETF